MPQTVFAEVAETYMATKGAKHQKASRYPVPQGEMRGWRVGMEAIALTGRRGEVLACNFSVVMLPRCPLPAGCAWWSQAPVKLAQQGFILQDPPIVFGPGQICSALCTSPQGTTLGFFGAALRRLGHPRYPPLDCYAVSAIQRIEHWDRRVETRAWRRGH